MAAKSGLGDIDEHLHANRAGLGTIGPLNVGGIAAEWKGANHFMQASLSVSPSPEFPTWEVARRCPVVQAVLGRVGYARWLAARANGQENALSWGSRDRGMPTS